MHTVHHFDSKLGPKCAVSNFFLPVHPRKLVLLVHCEFLQQVTYVVLVRALGQRMSWRNLKSMPGNKDIARFIYRVTFDLSLGDNVSVKKYTNLEAILLSKSFSEMVIFLFIFYSIIVKLTLYSFSRMHCSMRLYLFF